MRHLWSAVLLFALASPVVAEENHAPFFANESPSTSRTVTAEERFEETFRVVDLDGDRVEVTAQGLPAGAKLRVRDPRPWTDEEGPAARDAKARYREVVLTWTPTRDQRGPHAAVLTATDGKGSESLELTLTVQEEWESWLLPGVQYVGWFPAGAGAADFHGAGFEFVIGSWVHQTEARGPSHGRVYVDLDLLAPRGGGARGYAYALGLDLSLERNPWRRWLIPIFGVEVGGVHQRELGSFFATTPFVGAHLLSARNVFLTVTGGYLFPGRDVERLGGWRVRASFDAALW